METKRTEIEFQGENIVIEEIHFGDVIYIYIGNESRTFDDLSLTMAGTLDSTSLLGEKGADIMGCLLSDITGKVVLMSYGFDTESEIDVARREYVSVFLGEHFRGKT